MSDATALTTTATKEVAPANNLLDLPANVDMTKARAMAATINVSDSQAVINYGVGTQTKISGFADSMLTQIRSKDCGEVGEILSTLMLKVKGIDIENLSNQNIFSKLFGGVASVLAKFEKEATHIERIVNELEKAMNTLKRDISMLDQLYIKNNEYLADLDICIAAAILKLEELRGSVLEDLRAKAQASGDPAEAQKFNDFDQALNRFEKKIHDLKLSRIIAIQSAPQIRLIQNNDQALVEKIQSSIVVTIPLWKKQIIMGISLAHQKKGAELANDIDETTNKLLLSNAAALKQGSIEVAKVTQRGVVDVETLKKVHEDLIATIDETARIEEEGKAARKQAEQELSTLETELNQKLTSLKSNLKG